MMGLIAWPYKATNMSTEWGFGVNSFMFSNSGACVERGIVILQTYEGGLDM